MLSVVPEDIRCPIASDDDIVAARQRARQVARDMGFGALDQSRIATAVSELTRNVVRYATNSRGEVVLRRLTQTDQRVGIEVTVSDEGPGIAEVEEALQIGFTSGRGMGLGLPGAKRLMDDMTIETGAGRGTVITVRKWLR